MNAEGEPKGHYCLVTNMTTKQQDADCVTVAFYPKTTTNGTVITTGPIFLNKSTYVLRYASNKVKLRLTHKLRNPIMIYVFFYLCLPFVTNENIEKLWICVNNTTGLIC